MRLRLTTVTNDHVTVGGVDEKILTGLTNALQTGSAVQVQGANGYVWINPKHVALATLEREED